uniref:Uncharacterized protein n=1 Tax=Cacopsylla melanoneura TaxID=428564 RepID=A0A8D8R0I9_9HEMI
MKFTLYLVASALVLTICVVNQSAAARTVDADRKYEISSLNIISTIQTVTKVIYDWIPFPQFIRNIIAYIVKFLEPIVIKRSQEVGLKLANDALAFASRISH